MSFKNRYKEIANKTEEISQFVSKIMFYGNTFTLPKTDDRRKINFNTALHIARQSANQSQVLVLENLYSLLIEIKQDETVTPEQRFDLAWGEIELCLMESARWFSDRYAKKGEMGEHSIEAMRKRYGIEV